MSGRAPTAKAKEEGALVSVSRILGWALAAAIALCVGFALLGIGWIALQAIRSEISLGQVRIGVLWSFYAANFWRNWQDNSGFGFGVTVEVNPEEI